MANPYTRAQEYWGYLIERDKTPTPLLEQLLLGLANYIIREVTPWEVRCLTPSKLAEYYRLVGGNYDDLFLKCEHESLSFMYRSLGCFHALQPGSNPFAAPTLPALTPRGFVRWQFIQILLDPDAHVPLLQEAVKRFEIHKPDGGEPFPRLLPDEALPYEADNDILEWHRNALETLRQNPVSVPSATVRGKSPSPKWNDEVQSITDSSADDSSFVDASDYFQPQRNGSTLRAPPRIIPPSPETEISTSRHESRSLAERDRRRRSEIDRRSISDEPWLSDGPTPTGLTAPSRSRPQHIGRSHTTRAPRRRSPDEATGQTTNTLLASERSRRADHSPRPTNRLAPFLDAQGRRHSASNIHDRRHPHRRYEPPQSHTLSPPFFARPNPPDLSDEISLPRPQSAVRFDTPDYEPRRPRAVSRPVRSASLRYSSSSESEHEERRSSSHSRADRRHGARRTEQT